MSKLHKNHPEHLCAMIAGGEGLKQVRKLVVDARYLCAKCGRAARKKKNLCSARKIEQA